MIDLKKIKKEYEAILKELSDPEIFSNNPEKAKKLGKRKSYLDPIVERIKKIEQAQKKKKGNEEIIKEDDEELKKLAKESNKKMENEIEELKEEIKEIVKNKNNFQGRPILVEIRAGAGGEEAALFAAELYNMYSKYAKEKDWKLKILNSNKTELEGLKEISFELRGKEVYPNMKHEAGVHRVQRIPETEKSGRIHTSTVSVAVFPKPKKAEIKIDPSKIEIDRFRASGPGGQNVNKRETAIRITHIPTGITVSSQTERRQEQNKENALNLLRAKILEEKREKRRKKIEGKRQSQIGHAERSEKIRTYNFPQDRITDHRINKNWHHIEEVMDGDLNQITKTLKESEEEEII